MTNTPYGVVTKVATLIPIVAAIYFFDILNWWGALLSSSSILTFVVLTASLFALGVILKRRILRVSLELSNTSFFWGLLFLVSSAILYVYGSYSPGTPWFRYESLLALVLSYMSFRVGTRILRVLAPLITIFAFSFIPFAVLPFISGLWSVLVTLSLFLLLFLKFLNFQLKSMVLPVYMVVIGFAAWYHPALTSSLRTAFLIPELLLVLAIPRLRDFFLLPPNTLAKCDEHHVLENGFCSICGRKSGVAERHENIGILGLFAVVFVGALLLFAYVPILALRSGLPYDAFYGTQGFSSIATPRTPAGWQINSTTIDKSDRGAIYAIKQVYVPIANPDVKNYTLYYDVSRNIPVTGAPSNELPGYNLLPSQSYSYGPFIGNVITYTRPGGTLLVYNGRATMTFLTDSGFQSHFVGVSFVREFKNSNVNLDTSRFIGDINALWLPDFKNDLSYSGWGEFVGTAYFDAMALTPTFILVSSSATIGWLAYRARRSDERLDRFLTLAATLAEERWNFLSALLQAPRRRSTGSDLIRTSETVQSAALSNKADLSLRAFERMRLVKRVLVERGEDLILVWKAAV